MRQKLKSFLANDALFYGVLLISTAIASFGLGKQSVLQVNSEKSIVKQAEFVDTESAPLAPSPTQIIPTAITPTELQATAGEVVASKSGSKYHLPTCAGAKQIKPENLISFASASAAEAAGYTPAANCKGLQ